MAFTGPTQEINFASSGFNYNPNVDAIPLNAMSDGSINFDLSEQGIRKRGGTLPINATAVTGTPEIRGLTDFRIQSGTSFVPFAGSDGKIYKDTVPTVLKTGMSTSNYFSFAQFKFVLYVADGANRPQTWDGAAGSTSDITSIPTSWTGSNFPAQLFTHGRGASNRMLAIGCPNDKETVWISETGDAQDFSDANVVQIPIRTNDGFGIVAGVEFGDRAILFSKNQAYILDDDNVDDSLWGYQLAQWAGGVAHWRLLVKTPNDLVAMTETGEIYSVRAAQSYGDYTAASLSNPPTPDSPHIDRWIRNNVNLAQIDKFHAAYDPTKRVIYFFIVRSGQTEVDAALLYYIDRPPQIAWAYQGNIDAASGFSASASAPIRVSAGVNQIYTGDFAGKLWKLDQTNRSDNDVGYTTRARTPSSAYGAPRMKKRYFSGRVVTQPEGDFDLTARWLVDGVEQDSRTISLAGTGGVFDTGEFDDAVFAGENVIDNRFVLGKVGKRLALEFVNSTANQDFFLSSALVDLVNLGGQR